MKTTTIVRTPQMALAGYVITPGALGHCSVLVGDRLMASTAAVCPGDVRPLAGNADIAKLAADHGKGDVRVRSLGPPD